jgi:phage tail sheath gpL-like
MPTTWIQLQHNESAASVASLFGVSELNTLANRLQEYISALSSGTRQGKLLVGPGEYTGTQATGTVAISSGSGSITATINGIATAVTWATSDTATGAALAAAINASTSSLVKDFVTATASTGTVTITAIAKDASGDAITLSASGTGATASGATLTGSLAKAASGTLTISSGSGAVGGTIGGTSVTVTWATSDTASAAALAAAINANTTVNKWVVATSALGVCTVTALVKGVIGNNVTLVASGTGVTASAARLAGGLDVSYTTFNRS